MQFPVNNFIFKDYSLLFVCIDLKIFHRILLTFVDMARAETQSTIFAIRQSHETNSHEILPFVSRLAK